MYQSIESKQANNDVPVTLQEWERTLVQYFLGIGQDGNASDIHSFEISRRTLALACGAPEALEKDVERSFHKALTADPQYLLQSLKAGPVSQPDDLAPNYFAFLAMTLFIDILLDNQSDAGNEFRAKLADWLGIDRTFNDLRGVATMWRALVEWLDLRVAAGAAFRRLVLPEPPKSWKHIGYTRRLSFPNRADVRVVAQALTTLSKRDRESPAEVLNAFTAVISRGIASPGLKEAYDDFRRSYFARRRAIADHRFWRLVTQVRIDARGAAARMGYLDFSFTEDGDREFQATDESGYSQLHGRFVDAIADHVLISTANLGPSIKHGMLFFRQTGIGRWQAEPELARCRDRAYVAYRSHLDRMLGQRLGKVEYGGDWRLTETALPIAAIDAALRPVNSAPGSADHLFRPSIFNGIRVRGAWLGLPGFLPCIETDTDKVRVHCERSSAVPIQAELNHGALQLVSENPLAGVYHIEPHLSRLETTMPWRLRIQFVDRAVPHGTLSGARRKLPTLSECTHINTGPITSRLQENLRWERANDAMEWLLEAVYASGAGGWEESELVSLLGYTSSESSVDPWRMLRMLQDGGVLEPRLRQQWRGRSWTLAAPAIIAATDGDLEVTLVEGGLCMHLLENFRLIVDGLGGQAFRLLGGLPWSVPVVGAIGVAGKALAKQLNWEFVEQGPALEKAPLALARTERHGEHYRIASTWCWAQRRFVHSGASEGKVRLTRRVHAHGKDHDLYRVEFADGVAHYLSRHAAIVAAHMAAKLPMFEFHNDRIEMMTREGALPDMLASTLRRRQLQAAGLDVGRYAYAACKENASWLLSLLPGCITGVPTTEKPSTEPVLSSTRRSRGARRLKWQNGELVL